VLELVDGGPVMKLDDTGHSANSIPMETAWKYFRDLIHGLNYLHVQNIIHRDIKPENLLVTSSGELKICDFGVSQVLDNSQQSLTSAKGSPAFLAPEISSRKCKSTADLLEIVAHCATKKMVFCLQLTIQSKYLHS
jgi:[calcium/calmodulin-dependent protein kinase] kinase